MNPRGLGLLIIVVLLIPTVSANTAAEDYGIGEITATAEGQVVPNYGYWVYGEVKNFEIYNIREVIVEVTTYDATGGLLDTLTTMVRPTIIDAGTKAPFLVKSTVQNQVYDVRVKILSYKRTEQRNFPYIELSDVSEVSQGVVTGMVSNIHPYIYVYEAEIIATFYDINGNVNDIKTYGANNYAQFDAGSSEQFTITSDIMTPVSVNLVTQCNRYYRDPVLTMDFSDYRPVLDQDMSINFTVSPKLSGHSMDVNFYPPSDDGAGYTVPITLYSDSTYSMNLQASELGVWTVEMVFIPTLVNNSIGYIEGKVVEDTFTVIEAPTIDSGDDVGSDTGDNVVDDIEEKLTTGIPGYPIAAILLCLTALSLVYRRRYAYDI